MTSVALMVTLLLGAPGDLIEWDRGTLPLILTIPHGGTMVPERIPDRISATLERYDVHTLELGRAIAHAMLRQSGQRPYVVIELLHRKKVDVNREMLEGAQDDSLAVENWTEYHRRVAEACSLVSLKFGRGFLVDLHGHRHRKPRVELGYLLDGRHLRLRNDSLARAMEGSSLRDLVRRSDLQPADLVRGNASLGTMLAAHGYQVVPSATSPDPGDDPYFSGGYTIERHGSSNGGVISAVQIETPLPGVRDTEANRQAFARAVADALLKFLELHYDTEH